jgi:hypothetical protein
MTHCTPINDAAPFNFVGCVRLPVAAGGCGLSGFGGEARQSGCSMLILFYLSPLPCPITEHVSRSHKLRPLREAGNFKSPVHVESLNILAQRPSFTYAHILGVRGHSHFMKTPTRLPPYIFLSKFDPCRSFISAPERHIFFPVYRPRWKLRTHKKPNRKSKVQTPPNGIYHNGISPYWMPARTVEF